MGTSAIDVRVVLRFADIATDALGSAREEIDALNVFPVPDGDTGTNLYLTVSGARDALREALETSPGRHEALVAFARGGLLSARGNSGVILSEMLGMLAHIIDTAPPDEPRASVVARGLEAASEAAYAAVGTPVEGTMLTVARAASVAARERADRSTARSGDVFEAAAEAAREALERTPEQLPALRDAGVVDAGGRGVVVLLEAVDLLLNGRRPVAPPAHTPPHNIPTPHLHGDLSADGPSYEVMYLLDAPDEAVPRLREQLSGLGDSLVVVGGEGLWNVHVHVDDVGRAVEAGIEAGRPYRIQVTHFAEQINRQQARAAAGRCVVAVSAGPGLSTLFREAGATVIEAGPGRRPSTGEVLGAIRACGAAEVIVLPNDHDSVRVSEAAARTAEQDDDVRVAVIHTAAQVQGLAAMAVHEPGRSFDRDVLEMTATARHARHGAVTIAAKRAMTMAGPCEVGDVLGVIDGDFIRVGEDLADVAADVLGRLIGGGGELVTIVSGREDADGELAQRSAMWVEEHHPTVEVLVYDGGQERYPLLVSVE
ncbi:DAK2 domain-containing protein [Nocardioides insulae]|uniref:DAK2 domain-containing protein n=1 Tax=Nocardioides insulae TaxID=394734 RepID=UPI0003FD01C5|nr:DAK2 domain-containing protein [Nocardioides insulae]